MTPTDWYARLRKHAHWGWMSLLIFVAVACLVGFSQRDDYFGKDNKDLDYRYLGYSPQEVHDLLHNIGPNGRETYAFTAVTLDLLFPLTFGTLMVFITVRNYPKNIGRKLLWLPVIVVALDLLENAFIVYFTMSYVPGELPALAGVASVVTMAKWAFGLLGFLVLVVGVIGRRGGWINPHSHPRLH
jgi:hypothetical protein